MVERRDVLVAVVNTQRDLDLLREQHWYRIPVKSVEMFLKTHWPPDWLAIYQTRKLSHDACTIRYYACVIKIQTAYRYELFRDESQNEKSQTCYYKLELSALQELPQPIANRSSRRITFITTTMTRLTTAIDIKDL
jgi:hypothetical protein